MLVLGEPQSLLGGDQYNLYLFVCISVRYVKTFNCCELDVSILLPITSLQTYLNTYNYSTLYSIPMFAVFYLRAGGDVEEADSVGDDG